MSKVLKAVTAALAEVDNRCRSTHFILHHGDDEIAIPVPRSGEEYYRSLLQKISRIEVERLRAPATLCESPTKKCNHTFFIDQTVKTARDEAAEGRIVMILVPTVSHLVAVNTKLVYGETRIHVRASTVTKSLKSLPIDTLILVGQSHSKWNKGGEIIARELVKTSFEPRII